MSKIHLPGNDGRSLCGAQTKRIARPPVTPTCIACQNGGKAPVFDESSEPNWEGKCEVCGQGPTVKETGLCGPCTFGEADTAGGNW